MTGTEFLLATRGSELARRQTQLVADGLHAAWPGLTVREEIIRTTGDRHPQADLTALGGSGVFTKELQRAVLARQTDAAVHSLKDLPVEASAGLLVAAVLARGNPADVLVSSCADGLGGLAQGARVGTGSPRRAAMIRALRRDVDVVSVRGNVPTRVALVAEGRVDAVILAAAGLERLGMPSDGPFAHGNAGLHAAVLPTFLPAPGQGAIAVEVRSDDAPALERVAALHDAVTAAEVQAERAVLRALGGGCHMAVGVLGKVADGILEVSAVLFDAPDSEPKMARLSGRPDEAEDIGRAVAELLRS